MDEATIEGLAFPRCFSREPQVVGGEDVRARVDERKSCGQARLSYCRMEEPYLRVPQPPRGALRERR